MRIAIANVSDIVSSGEFRTGVHAVERQVHEDFAPLWGMNASIRMLRISRNAKPDPDAALSDAIIYVGELNDDPQSVADALGYHSDNLSGVPYGFVFTDVAAQVGEAWTTTLSHEVLELLADPEVNLMVLAPHPTDARKTVLRPYEVCDPVQGDIYSVDGVGVSNFVTPLYFADLPHPTVTQTNYLKLSLDRFGVRPNGYYSYLDLARGKYVDVFGNHILGAEIAKLKQPLGTARRQARRATVVRRLIEGGS